MSEKKAALTLALKLGLGGLGGIVLGILISGYLGDDLGNLNGDQVAQLFWGGLLVLAGLILLVSGIALLSIRCINTLLSLRGRSTPKQEPTSTSKDS